MAPRAATRDRNEAEQSPTRETSRDNLPASQPQRVPAIVEFKNYMDQRLSSLVQALPPHISPNTFSSVTLTALQRKPDLLACTKQSLWNACILAAQDGLLPDGREGAIVPYGEGEGGKKKAEIATWMPMVEGLRKKARNSGEIAKWEVNLVRGLDKFKVSLGDNAEIVHEPYFGPEENSQIVGAYSIATLRDGSVMRDVMTIREINSIRAKSRAQKGPWSDMTFFPEMCRKTMARRHYKQLPHSAEMDRMIDRDDREFGLETDPQAIAQQAQQRRAVSVGAAFDTFAAGNTIEHDPDDATPQDMDDAIDPDTGEVRDDPPATQPSRTATTAQERADERPRQQERDRPKSETSREAEREATGKSSGRADENKTAKGSDLSDDQPSRQEDTSFDDGIDHDARNWPDGDVPADADQYELYLDTMIAKATSGDALKKQWVEDGNLRRKIGVPNDQVLRLKEKVIQRIEDLTKKSGGKR